MNISGNNKAISNTTLIPGLNVQIPTLVVGSMMYKALLVNVNEQDPTFGREVGSVYYTAQPMVGIVTKTAGHDMSKGELTVTIIPVDKTTGQQLNDWPEEEITISCSTPFSKGQWTDSSDLVVRECERIHRETKAGINQLIEKMMMLDEQVEKLNASTRSEFSIQEDIRTNVQPVEAKTPNKKSETFVPHSAGKKVRIEETKSDIRSGYFNKTTESNDEAKSE